MSKIKNLSDLGELYSAIQQTAANVTEVKNSNEQPDILLTDATNYLPKGSTPKVGEGFGKKEEKLAPKTGPEAAEGFDKKLAKEEQEAAEETEKEKKDMEAAEKNEEAPEKEEKVEENVESVSKSPKYKKQLLLCQNQNSKNCTRTQSIVVLLSMKKKKLLLLLLQQVVQKVQQKSQWLTTKWAAKRLT